eukprot:jgi/Tetstr1/459974/TSEL_005298.t1
MDKESRGRTVTNLIRTLSPKIGVQTLPTDVRVVTRRPPKPNAADPTAPSGTRLPTATGSGILRLARRETAVSVLQTQWKGEGTAILDRQGRCCSTRVLGAPHLDDIERPVHQVWFRSPSFSGLTEAGMWLHLAEGLLPAYDQPHPSEAATDQPAATPADIMALAGLFRCALKAKAICTGPLANLELPTVEQLAAAIAATMSQRINTPP